FFNGLVLLSLLSIVSCNTNKNSEPLKLSGKWIMTVTEVNNQNSIDNSIFKTDTTFNSLFRGLTYIPQNSEWSFVNDSVLIVRTQNNQTYKPDTLVYKISQKGDTLKVFSKDGVEKFPIKALSANRFELDFGDQTVTYQLNRK
ncbi:MAG TPA: hypothetical protein DCQ58_04870, partial [Saprospirales bacterium]|nr:hypothetical protein [Saprospirales bacterium]